MVETLSLTQEGVDSSTAKLIFFVTVKTLRENSNNVVTSANRTNRIELMLPQYLRSKELHWIRNIYSINAMYMSTNLIV